MADSPPPATPGDRAGRPDKAGKDRRVVRMGKYEVVEHIATGGMGSVYKARDTESGREVALKVLKADMASKPAMLERFRREARSADRLRHENIVRQFEFGEVGGTHYLAMEFIDGVDLHDYVKENGPIDPEEARAIILQGARALRYAHDQSIVHRDVKPSNFLMVRRDNRPLVKLADFGLAREVDADEFRVTRAGATVGTVDYMSPEQARDSGSADIRGDLYSLGCTWYHLLTGHAPFHQGGLGERLIKILHEEAPDVRRLNPRVSAECWGVLRRLLAKDPADRHQTPAELIDDLLTLEGKVTARPRPRPVPPGDRTPPRKKASTQTQAAAARGPAGGSRKPWYVAGGACAAVLLGVIVLLAVGRRQPPRVDTPLPSDATRDEPADRPGSPVVGGPGKGKGLKADPTPVPRPPVPEVRPLPLLAPGVRTIDARALRREVEKPWADGTPPGAGAAVVRVSRAAAAPAGFRSVGEALAWAPAGKPIVIEVHDNGPLFEAAAGTTEGRDVVLRAGKGYRPLIVWDLAAAARRPGLPPGRPLTYLEVRKGRLSVEGVEFAWRWPETLDRPAALFDCHDADLSVRDCGISGSGKPRRGVVLSRFRADRAGARCRWTRCQARGTNVVGLDLDAPAAEVLLDGCLWVGGQLPLLRVQAGAQGPRLRVARSTLVGGSTMLELGPSAPGKAPTLAWLGWDSLFSRSGEGTAGALVALRNGADTRGVEWRAVNCLYAGWGNLLRGAEGPAGPTVGDDLRDWHKHWARAGSEAVARDIWPEQVYGEPATQPAASYLPLGAVRFASTVAADRPLGCDLGALPATRDGWVALAFEPAANVPDLPSDDAAPEIPLLDDGKFHGGAVNLDDWDLGDYLARVQKRARLGPKVVLHLKGSGDRQTAPIRVKGATLVLHFAEPAGKDAPRLGLVFSRAPTPVPLLDVEGGSLEVIGGVLRVPDIATLRASHLIRVRGGDVRLYRTRLEGPQQGVPEGYVAALEVAGTGSPESARVCALNECVVLSSQAGVILSGVGCQLAMRQCVVVAGTEGLQVFPGKGCKGRTALACNLAGTTFACRRAVLRLGDAENAGLPTEPVVVTARDCAYLNPFPGQPSKAGLVAWEGDALARGLLLWQGEREGYDPRLHFGAAAASGPTPDAKEGVDAWQALWGSPGVRQPRRLPPGQLSGLFDPRRWPLERLIVRGTNPPGANVERLGLGPRKRPR